MKPQTFNTFRELKALLETLSEKELDQPVRTKEPYDDSMTFEVGTLAVDDEGLVLVS